ncbi:MAG: potassium-transporting ATPase subunit KdpC [bacterium]
MKKNLRPSIALTFMLLVLLGFGYPFLLWGIGQLMPENSKGSPIVYNDRIVGYENIGQSFTSSDYFQGRPSAVRYNAASTGGSNKGPSNPDYLAEVQARIDTFLIHNPEINKSEIPADLVTASGSGIDPHISVQAALIQIPRISKERNISTAKLNELVISNSEKSLFGMLGPERVNVLKINLALNNLK